MAKKDRERVRLSRTNDSSYKYDEVEELGFFERLFSPGTVDTDISEYEGTEFGDSVDDETIYTEEDSDTSESSTGSNFERFDKELRGKHRSACKNMTVGILRRSCSYVGQCDFVDTIILRWDWFISSCIVFIPFRLENMQEQSKYSRAFCLLY